jgi:hypothetical protein
VSCLFATATSAYYLVATTTHPRAKSFFSVCFLSNQKVGLAVARRVRGETRIVALARKALLLRGGHDPSVEESDAALS